MDKQIRVTIPKWIVKLKKWGKAHIEVVPINVKDDDKPLPKFTSIYNQLTLTN